MEPEIPRGQANLSSRDLPDPQKVREVQEDYLEKKRPLIIIGPMAAGKSYIGTHFARFYGFPFVDADHLIVEKYGSISEIFEERGEEFFRKVEAEVISEVLTSPHFRNCVFSLGGGAPMSDAVARLLRGEQVVYIQVDAETVRPRIEHNKNRPLLQPHPVQKWSEIFEQRAHRYEELASYILDARGGRPITEMAAELYEFLQKERSEEDINE
ncbi:shikimate kinase [Mycobacteroides abscessus subsp. abscessus]|nr:shikimate kinase [Mycobacteroides abscessus subsp. abscessus]